ncbi:hypothetical protein CVT26_013128 [Gymnopilus dilepis]|uniref:Cyclin-like domain-containing protein n=1 Tax=Gymnopilus dilepis TaxID=231916 RepID=A0A409WV05_9AGAR|nr:hypothetical protein CVT26_013128 [Gymnopilus dilepis]
MVSHLNAIHPASLVDSAIHAPELLALIKLEISSEVIEYAIDAVIEVVYSSMEDVLSFLSAPGSAGKLRRTAHATFATFVIDVLTRARVTMATLLATFVYIERARSQLHIVLEQWALERVFLGALIVASKYLNDSTLKNVHWALCSGIFTKSDVNRIEREYLDILNFRLSITEDDLLGHYEGLSWAISDLPRLPLQRTAAASDNLSLRSPSPANYTYKTSRVCTITRLDDQENVAEPMHRRRSWPTAFIDLVPELSPASALSSPESDLAPLYLPWTPSLTYLGSNMSATKLMGPCLEDEVRPSKAWTMSTPILCPGYN